MTGDRGGPRRQPERTQRRGRRAQLDPARQAAFDVLRAVSEQDAYANLALPALLTERGISGRDAAFATELTYGTCRTRGLMDAVISAAAARPVDQIDPVLLDLLRLGAYQLLRTNVADHAAVSTCNHRGNKNFAESCNTGRHQVRKTIEFIPVCRTDACRMRDSCIRHKNVDDTDCCTNLFHTCWC